MLPPRAVPPACLPPGTADPREPGVSSAAPGRAAAVALAPPRIRDRPGRRHKALSGGLPPSPPGSALTRNR